MNTMHQRHRSFQLLMPIFSEKWRHFVAVNVFANHVYNLIKWGKSSQNAVMIKQRIEDSACWIAGISFMSPRYVMRKNLRRTSPGCRGMLCATKTLTFKTRVSAKSLWCKGVLFAWDEYEIVFKPIPSHLALLWHWALEQLSNCQFSLYLYCYLFPFFLFFTCISTCRLTQKFQLNTTSWKTQK